MYNSFTVEFIHPAAPGPFYIECAGERTRREYASLQEVLNLIQNVLLHCESFTPGASIVSVTTGEVVGTFVSVR